MQARPKRAGDERVDPRKYSLPLHSQFRNLHLDSTEHNIYFDVTPHEYLQLLLSFSSFRCAALDLSSDASKVAINGLLALTIGEDSKTSLFQDQGGSLSAPPRRLIIFRCRTLSLLLERRSLDSASILIMIETAFRKLTRPTTV